ncbi:hypothetical protein [Mesorhizobium sp. CA5]|uniref:hypothetical protein n=1 Tax=Mesorhizobium sp. CA5 TaxID=2876638 RepID=UPI001CD0F01F|nr:hypothetical protein [Mesorhizobium sp. CA5]MBZ9843717.1 hypothetical protein [Mesorhizobium sp. CA5]
MPATRHRWSLLVAVGCLWIGGSVAWSQDTKPDQQSRSSQPSTTENLQSTKQDSEPRTLAPEPSQPVGKAKGADDQQGSAGKEWRENLVEHAPDWSVAFFTFILCVFTGLLWRSTNKLWLAGEKQMKLIQDNAALQSADMQASIKVAEDAAKAANRSAEVAERTMVLNDRPWVGVELQILGPLVFTAHDCSIKLDMTITNHGRSPAIRTDPHVEFFVSTQKAIEWRNKMEDSARYMIANMFGETLFPTVPRSKKWSFSVSRDDILRGKTEDDENCVRPIVAYCVYYGLPTGGRARYTSGIREIFRIGHEPFDGDPATFTDHEIRFLDMVTEDAT